MLGILSVYPSSTGQSIEELYLSANVFLERGAMFHYDEPLCLPDIPCFTTRCVALIADQVPIWTHSCEVHRRPDVHAVVVKQNGYHIACFNLTLIKKNRPRKRRFNVN
uniref:Uncharacterized protein n=1 Tax=Hucho hucho TaxID=62062 RepID=A0A4W5MTM0_9TELE